MVIVSEAAAADESKDPYRAGPSIKESGNSLGCCL